MLKKRPPSIISNLGSLSEEAKIETTKFIEAFTKPLDVALKVLYCCNQLRSMMPLDKKIAVMIIPIWLRSFELYEAVIQLTVHGLNNIAYMPLRGLIENKITLFAIVDKDATHRIVDRIAKQSDEKKLRLLNKLLNTNVYKSKKDQLIQECKSIKKELKKNANIASIDIEELAKLSGFLEQYINDYGILSQHTHSDPSLLINNYLVKENQRFSGFKLGHSWDLCKAEQTINIAGLNLIETSLKVCEFLNTPLNDEVVSYKGWLQEIHENLNDQLDQYNSNQIQKL